MAKQKGEYRERKNGKRPRTSGGYTAKPTYVARLTERKYFDSLLSAAAIATSTDWTGTELDPATANALFTPGPGTGINQRVGRKVNVLGLRIRGNLNAPSQVTQASGDHGVVVRVICYQDRQTNGAQSQGEDVMVAPATATSLLATQSMMSLANLGKFNILKDKIYKFEQPSIANDAATTGNLTQTGQTIPFKYNIKFKKPITVHFNATGGTTVADIVDNSFHIIGTCSNNAMAVTMNYQCRTVFVDA